MIQIVNATKSFGKFKAIDDINIHVKKGTIFGLIGENGAGKTTLIQCMTGIYKPDQGKITINGEQVYENPIVKERIGYVADQNQYFPFFKVKEMVEFYKKTYPSFLISKFNQYNSIFKLDENKRVRQLSKGMQMRLSLMLNLSINPDVLILDEPTSGLDTIAKKQVLDILLQEVAERQLTIFISSHHLSELERICDEIAMIHSGKITYMSTLDEMKENIKKLQIVFDHNDPVDLGAWEEVRSVEKIGRVYYIITQKYSKEIEEKLYNAGAKFVEHMSLSLEEVFIYTCEEVK